YNLKGNAVFLLLLLLVRCEALTHSIKITIKEDEDIILNCSFGTDITGHRIEWKKDDNDVFHFDFGKEDLTVEDPKFKDRVARFSEDLKSGDASVKIQGAKVSDSGKYTCLHINQPGKAPVHQRLIELTVGEFIFVVGHLSTKKYSIKTDSYSFSFSYGLTCHIKLEPACLKRF
uniref:Ig-like domain-containing protein n=1 Tax=Cyprinodon variegatus TaxID=28743 RepID=A0A3Q2FK78_CYPVA